MYCTARHSPLPLRCEYQWSTSIQYTSSSHVPYYTKECYTEKMANHTPFPMIGSLQLKHLFFIFIFFHYRTANSEIVEMVFDFVVITKSRVWFGKHLVLVETIPHTTSNWRLPK